MPIFRSLFAVGARCKQLRSFVGDGHRTPRSSWTARVVFSPYKPHEQRAFLESRAKFASTPTEDQDPDLCTCLSRRAGNPWQLPPPTLAQIPTTACKVATTCSRQDSHIAGPRSRASWDKLRYDGGEIMLSGHPPGRACLRTRCVRPQEAGDNASCICYPTLWTLMTGSRGCNDAIGGD
jgi:hypothetical protein